MTGQGLEMHLHEQPPQKATTTITTTTHGNPMTTVTRAGETTGQGLKMHLCQAPGMFFIYFLLNFTNVIVHVVLASTTLGPPQQTTTTHGGTV